MSHATTPGHQRAAPGAPRRSRLSRALWGEPAAVRRAWTNVLIGQIAVAGTLYAASDEGATWARVLFLVGAIALEVNFVGQLVLAYRHRRRQREWPYDVG